MENKELREHIEKILRNAQFMDSTIGQLYEIKFKTDGKEQAVQELSQLFTTELESVLNENEKEVKNKLLASINSFLAEQGIKDTDGTPLTFSPERF